MSAKRELLASTSAIERDWERDQGIVRALGGDVAVRVFTKLQIPPGEVLQIYTCWLNRNTHGDFCTFLARIQFHDYGTVH